MAAPHPGAPPLVYQEKIFNERVEINRILTVDNYFYNNTAFEKGTRKATRIRNGLKN